MTLICFLDVPISLSLTVLIAGFAATHREYFPGNEFVKSCTVGQPVALPLLFIRGLNPDSDTTLTGQRGDGQTGDLFIHRGPKQTLQLLRVGDADSQSSVWGLERGRSSDRCGIYVDLYTSMTSSKDRLVPSVMTPTERDRYGEKREDVKEM